jgi:CheY-like chemotaxis protein/HPt (histidine-containing phosphotransfer) domain-containing protein
LERQGYKVKVASGGVEALDCLQQHDFDLVLMDVHMPGMNGLETTEAIRRNEQGSKRRLPIVALTAYSSPDDVRNCLHAGMDGHIAKPLNPVVLEQTLRQFLANGKEVVPVVERAPATPPAEAPPQQLPFDRERTLQRLSDNPQLLVEVAGLFHQSSGETLERIRMALDKNDFRTVREAAHTLCGSMSFFSAANAVQAARQVEKAVDGGQGILEAVAELRGQVERLRSALLCVVQESVA